MAVTITIPTHPDYYGAISDDEAYVYATVLADAVEAECPEASIALVRETSSYNNQSHCDHDHDTSECPAIQAVEAWLDHHWVGILHVYTLAQEA
jgi:hypothetical protein